MKKFILKTALFTFPFFLLFVITSLFYSTTESPDLLRLGCFPNVYSEYREVFHTEFNRKIYFHEFSKTKKKKSKILVIGDSFSDQDNHGFKNYLAEKHEVLYIDRFISGNQIQTLYELLNGDFFEKHNVEYIILENVERSFVKNAKSLDPLKATSTLELYNRIDNYKPIEENEQDQFFSKKIVQFPYCMVRYYIDDNYLSNRFVYNLTIKRNDLFSNNSNKLLFVNDDLKNIQLNNDLAGVQVTNEVLNDLSNKLKGKKVKLIVLPAPDKYDFYYDYIVDKTNFTKPLFFTHLNSLKKEYIYIDSKTILSAQIERKKDIYFYDDTHWSPVASKIISDEIGNKIRSIDKLSSK